MHKPPRPDNESIRIKALHDLQLLDTPLEESFERVTRLAKLFYKVPIVGFSLIDSERQWFKSVQGLDVCQTARDVAFCAYTINQNSYFVVNDALKDPRFIDNSLVVESPNIRFYAGFPIAVTPGCNIGTLCIVDRSPRIYTPAELQPLRDMAALIEVNVKTRLLSNNQLKLIDELNEAKAAQYIDSLTRIWNRAGVDSLLTRQIDDSAKNDTGFGIAMIDIDNFKSINDTYGHDAGDSVLRIISKRLLASIRSSDIVGRWGGEEFLVILNTEDSHELARTCERIRAAVCETPVNIENKKSSTVSVTIGLSYYNQGKHIDVADIIKRADAALYRGKREGKNKAVLDIA